MTLELKDKKKFVEDKRKEILFCTFDGVDCMDNRDFVINAEFGYCWEFKAEKNKVIAIDIMFPIKTMFNDCKTGLFV